MRHYKKRNIREQRRASLSLKAVNAVSEDQCVS